LALDRAHAIGERQELLIAADRDRIARDLHDLVIQRLYSTGLQLQAARNGDAAGMGAAIAASVRDIDTSIRDLRATIFELGRGLTSTLSGEARGLVQEYAAALGFQPALRLSGPVDTALTASVADEALLVLREALSNIARHAHATAAQVELTASAAWFMLRVADDGVGMAPDAGVASGLRNAQRRAESLGGVIRMGAATPHGASLVWLVPAAR
ncbi:sensor histidine kinase, partial [Nocardioides sp. CER28]